MDALLPDIFGAICARDCNRGFSLCDSSLLAEGYGQNLTRRCIKVVDESDDWIVIDKPAHLQAHPSKPDGSFTLWHGLRELLAFEVVNGGQVSIINRLDRETSGLVLVAKTSEAARRFGLLMQQQRLHKEYLAIVWGWPEWETKIVDAPLDRQGKYRQSPIW